MDLSKSPKSTGIFRVMADVDIWFTLANRCPDMLAYGLISGSFLLSISQYNSAH